MTILRRTLRLRSLGPAALRRRPSRCRVAQRRAAGVVRALEAAIAERERLGARDARALLDVARSAALVLPRGLEPEPAAGLERALARSAARLAAFFELVPGEPAPGRGQVRVGPGARRRIARIDELLEAARRRGVARAARAVELVRLEAEADAARGARPGSLRARSLRLGCRRALELGLSPNDARLLSCLFGRRRLLEGDPRLAELCARLGRREGALPRRAGDPCPGARTRPEVERAAPDALGELRARLAGRRVLVIAERPSLRRTGSLEALFEGARLSFADPRPGGRFGGPRAALAGGGFELVLELARPGAGRRTELLGAGAPALPWVRVAPGISAAGLAGELTAELVASDA